MQYIVERVNQVPTIKTMKREVSAGGTAGTTTTEWAGRRFPRHKWTAKLGHVKTKLPETLTGSDCTLHTSITYAKNFLESLKAHITNFTSRNLLLSDLRRRVCQPKEPR